MGRPGTSSAPHALGLRPGRNAAPGEGPRPMLAGEAAARFERRRAVVRQQMRSLERARRILAGEPILRLHGSVGSEP